VRLRAHIGDGRLAGTPIILADDLRLAKEIKIRRSFNLIFIVAAPRTPAT
jgi:hypothetical protein